MHFLKRATSAAARGATRLSKNSASICCQAKARTTLCGPYSAFGIETATGWHLYASRIKTYQGSPAEQDIKDLEHAKKELQNFLAQNPKHVNQLQSVQSQITEKQLIIENSPRNLCEV
jgi:hypothetical protein